MKLAKNYEQCYDNILHQIQNDFDYKKIIEETPVMLKDKKSINIWPEHLKHFIVTLDNDKIENIKKIPSNVIKNGLKKNIVVV